jgi:hypothetical protein
MTFKNDQNSKKGLTLRRDIMLVHFEISTYDWFKSYTHSKMLQAGLNQGLLQGVFFTGPT